jgi:hypothetical protein
MSNSLPKAVKEAKSLLKDVEKKKVKTPVDEREILNWSVPELRAYVLRQTSGMNPTKKMKWAMDLDKKIKNLKAQRDKLNSQNN